MNAAVQDNTILFPVGRLVQGDLYAPQEKDQQGNQLTIKTGPNAGKPRVNYYFALAIAKTPGVAHWGGEAGWGQKIWALGHAYWPQLIDPATRIITNPRFAWKIEDGDSQVPNQNNRKNADREGHAGHWIVKFGSSFPTKVFDEQGNPLLQAGLVKCGFWVEVLGTIASNENTQNPGIYVNHSMVAYRAPGKEIASGPDPRAVGFGRSALPAGVTAAPVGQAANFPAAASPLVPPAAGPGVPGAPGAGIPPAPPAAAPGVPGAPAMPVPVQPNPAFIAPPGGAALPPPPAAPAAPGGAAPPPATAVYPDPLGAPAGYKMANGAGHRYESYRAQGWTDAQMIAANHMVRLQP